MTAINTNPPVNELPQKTDALDGANTSTSNTGSAAAADTLTAAQKEVTNKTKAAHEAAVEAMSKQGDDETKEPPDSETHAKNNPY